MFCFFKKEFFKMRLSFLILLFFLLSPIATQQIVRNNETVNDFIQPTLQREYQIAVPASSGVSADITFEPATVIAGAEFGVYIRTGNLPVITRVNGSSITTVVANDHVCLTFDKRRSINPQKFSVYAIGNLQNVYFMVLSFKTTNRIDFTLRFHVGASACRLPPSTSLSYCSIPRINSGQTIPNRGLLYQQNIAALEQLGVCGGSLETDICTKAYSTCNNNGVPTLACMDVCNNMYNNCKNQLLVSGDRVLPSNFNCSSLQSISYTTSDNCMRLLGKMEAYPGFLAGILVPTFVSIVGIALVCCAIGSVLAMFGVVIYFCITWKQKQKESIKTEDYYIL